MRKIYSNFRPLSRRNLALAIASMQSRVEELSEATYSNASLTMTECQSIRDGLVAASTHLGFAAAILEARRNRGAVQC